MNIRKTTLSSLFFLFLIVTSCTKDGEMGPAGPRGERGDKGEQGLTGDDGSRIHSGTTAPLNSLGDIGDFYFNSNTSDFYGPKTTTGWGAPTSLRGATGAKGATGTAGSKILAGATAPATNLGAVGDFYFRNTTADFYGPKVASGWGTPINLKGAKGEDGTRIYSGATTPAATLGQIGDFYFHTTESDFYGPKTAAGWGTPSNLRGATGATGAAGSKILAGAPVPATNLGAVGDFYFRNTTADFYGPKTTSGWGTPINLKGVKGEDGTRIYSGATTPAYTLGRVGDFYFHTETGDFYGPKTAEGGWGIPTNLKGDNGNRIYGNAISPTNSVGTIGDFYINTFDGNFYGPKTATGWGTPKFNLKGPQGPPGSANVMYSNWKLITIFTMPTLTNVFRIEAPELTDEIFISGQILVYRRTREHPGAPFFVEQLMGPSSNAAYYYKAYSGYIDIHKASGNFEHNGIDGYRYVLVPGGVRIGANINVKDFNQVKAALSIKD